jgi:hypothetical protein
MDAMGGDTDWERTNKELTSTILATPQTLNSTERETINQLAIKARDSLEKKKKGSKSLFKEEYEIWLLSGGARQGNLYIAVCTPLYFPMIIGCWNVRGLNDPIKHSALRRLIHQERIPLFGLVETRVRDKNKDNVSQLLLRNWSILYNYDFSCRGRIWVCWNANAVKVDVFRMLDQAIHVSITILATNICFNTSIIYGDNNASLREALWSNIVSHSDGWESTPRIHIGDFNAICNQSSKSGGSTTWAGTMDRLDTCIREAKVDDLRYSSMHYTWSNQCAENLIMQKLDRVLVNKKWNLNFPLSKARFLPSGMLDHSPMVVKVIGNDQNIKKPFRFFDMWMDHDEFMPLVKKVWDQNSGGCPMYQLCCKLRKLKQELKLFNLTHFSNISNRVKDAKNDMDKAQ